ncbi:MAG TPA: cytochrome c oxidase subunit 3 [Anaerolineales bacterium]|nr:cytochrome c oxidase subunit 3 [Anaerolineales bacterium]
MAESPASDALVAPRDHTKLAFWLFLGSEVVFFTALILTLLLHRFSHTAEFSAFRARLSIPIIGINTFILITSSYMVVRSLEAAVHHRPTLMRYLAAVLVLGALFLAGQAFEWSTLFAEGESFKSLLGTSFFTVTGIHGTHVLVGLIWCGVLMALIGRKALPSPAPNVELFGLYWHFVDVVWIVLFTVIYLI